MDRITPGDQGRAAAYLAQVNMAIIKAAAARRMGHGITAPGARPPASLAGAAIQGRILTEPRSDGRPAPITPLGYRTAVRSLPRILAMLDPSDPRRRAALVLADTMERVGSVRGPDLGGSAPKSGRPDGGVTTRVKHAARLARIEALANGWAISRTGAIHRGRPRVALEVGRQTGKLQEIKAYPALVAMCVDGISADQILRNHGWAAKSKARGRLAEALLAALDDVADGLGYGRWGKERA